MSENSFNVNKFFADSKEVLVNPKGFFSSMPTSGGLGEPIIKALFYGLIAAIFKLLWGLLNFGGIFGGIFGIGSFFLTLLGAILGVFILAVIVLILSAICSGSTDFEQSMRVASALMIFMPLKAFFAFFGGINFYLGEVISIVISLYSFYLLYIALIEVLKSKASTARILMYVLAGILVIFMLIGMGTRRVTHNLMRYGKNYQNVLGEFQKGMEETAKEMEEYTADFADAIDQQEENSSSDATIEEFPEKALEKFKEHLSSGPDQITPEMISSIMETHKALAEYSDDQEKAKEIVTEHGYADYLTYVGDFTKVVTAYTVLGALNAIEKNLEASKEEQEAAKAFTLDPALEAMVTQPLQSVKLTENDLRLVYEHLEEVEELQKSNE